MDKLKAEFTNYMKKALKNDSIDYFRAERKKNNFHGSKINNHCKTKPKKRKGRQTARKDAAENSVIMLGDTLASHERNKILIKEGKKKPRRYY